LINSKILKKHQIATHPVNRLNALAPGVFRRCQLRNAALPEIKVAIAGSPTRATLIGILLRVWNLKYASHYLKYCSEDTLSSSSVLSTLRIKCL
jgi:hypothetical protein